MSPSKLRSPSWLRARLGPCETMGHELPDQGLGLGISVGAAGRVLALLGFVLRFGRPSQNTSLFDSGRGKTTPNESGLVLVACFQGPC
jgi:hypothetical protein